jgi:quercetin dioxygenase-like cupin family protein
MSRSSVYVPALDELEWKPLGEIIPNCPLGATGAEAKLLNRDPDTGAFTMVVKLPPAAGDARRGSHSCDQEVFLLEGDLTIDGESFRAPAYWFFPAGTIHGDSRTEAGAVLIESFAGACDFASATEDEQAAAPVSRGIDVDSVEWSATSELVDGYTYVGPLSKVLREDPETGGSTSMVRLPPGYTHPHLSFHQHTQEQFLLEGTVNETGVERHALAYWCHPPGEVHGKSFTLEDGCTSLLLFDGPWEVTIVEDEDLEHSAR